MAKNKRKNQKSIVYKVLILSVLFMASVLLLVPTLKNLNFGLDLKGGFEVLYQVESLDGSSVDSSKMSSTYKTISKRIDVLGVSEPTIEVEGEDRIRVGLAGVTNQEEARKILSKAASLTFRDTSDNLLMTADVISGAKVGTDEYGKPAVALSVKDKDAFYTATKNVSEMEDNRIVIWLDYEEGVNSFSKDGNKCGSEGDSRCLSVASVKEGFASDVVIQGNFTQKEVESLVDLINSGSLPTKLTEISSRTVEASFGAESLSKTFTAGLIGIAGIMVVMILLYHFAGVVASVGIAIYTLVTFAIFWLVGGVLTLPGIAAVVIGIGMAVDACVISFARIKDELRSGSKLYNAVKIGNKNSFMTIFDANFTTLVVAVILFIFGESSVKGFATMLIISILTTMFVMVYVTRWLINWFASNDEFADKANLFVGYKETKKEHKFNFWHFKKYSFIGLAVLLIVGIATFSINGLNLGIDFKSGSAITLKSEQKLVQENIENDVKSLGYDIYDYEQIDDNNVIIRVSNALNNEEIDKTNAYFSEHYSATSNIGVVSNLVQRELIKNAIISLLLASIGIILYMTFRFEFSYAISGIIALIHDVALVVILFSIFKIEISSIFIAAILSIIGYSINDTIVSFDRIRENIAKKYNYRIKNKEELGELVNLSLRQTIDRSIITSVTTLIPVITLILFGANEIINFNLALLFGFIGGTYSSIFIATQIWGILYKKNIGKDLKKKWYDDEPEEKLIKGVNS